MTRVSPWLIEVLSNKPISSGSPAGIQRTRPVELNLFSKRPDGLRPPKNESRDDLIHADTDLTLGSCSYKLKQNKDRPNVRLFGQQMYVDQQGNHSSDANAKDIDAV